MHIQDIFTEQAEYITRNDLDNWHMEHPIEKMIMKKLCQGGAKLLTGPRGCGKTTLLLRAYNDMIRKKKVFSIYVNFKTSLKIEPLYKKNNGSYWFNQWLLLKVYKGIFESIKVYEIENSMELYFSETEIDNYISRIELGIINDISEIDELLTITILENEIKKILDANKMTSCILLLDDAAHAFSKEQQYDFFEFFRSIKSREISPKAAIYPGVTDFSASFHVGHDAEEIDVWVKTMDDEYLKFMTEILQKRFPEEIFSQLKKDSNLLTLICYASFGIPRALLNIVRNFFKEDDKLPVDFNRKAIFDSIKKINDSSMDIYKSLEKKLPIYKRFVEEGNIIYERMADALKQYNKRKTFERQAVEIGIKKPIPTELEKVLNFLQYAGLLMYEKEIAKGEEGRYAIYVINYGFLIEQNVFGGRQNIKNSELATALRIRDPHEFKKFTVESLLGTDAVNDIFPLSLPPCPKCHTPRISANTKFCSECGEKLTAPSIYDDLVNSDISNLPLTPYRVKKIKEESKIRTIKDILMDTEHIALRNVSGIGPYWVDRIFSYAEEYIS